MSTNKNEFVRAKVNCKITPGEMLRTLRELQELTQKEIADATGISQSNISAMENDGSQIGREGGFALSKCAQSSSGSDSLPRL